jgi:hypothetical protein
MDSIRYSHPGERPMDDKHYDSQWTILAEKLDGWDPLCYKEVARPARSRTPPSKGE